MKLDADQENALAECFDVATDYSVQQPLTTWDLLDLGSEECRRNIASGKSHAASAAQLLTYALMAMTPDAWHALREGTARMRLAVGHPPLTAPPQRNTQ